MTNLKIYKPFRDFWNLPDEMNRFFWGLERANRNEPELQANWIPAVDITEDAESVTIQAELPGVDKNDITIKVSDGVLTIQGERRFKEEKKEENYYHFERRYGTFARSFSLPRTVNGDKVEAAMKDGLLHLRIPKIEEAKPKQIQIQ